MTGRDLRIARLNRGFGLRELARHLDVPEQSLRRLEDNKSCSPGNAKKVADFFAVQVTDLAVFEEAA